VSSESLTNQPRRNRVTCARKARSGPVKKAGRENRRSYSEARKLPAAAKEDDGPRSANHFPSIGLRVKKRTDIYRSKNRPRIRVTKGDYRRKAVNLDEQAMAGGRAHFGGEPRKTRERPRRRRVRLGQLGMG